MLGKLQSDIYKKISQNFVESPLKFCIISQILVNSLWHICAGSKKKLIFHE